MSQSFKKCIKCGQEIKQDSDCWSTAFHVPFDTFLKVKEWANNTYLCNNCYQQLEKKEHQKLKKNSLNKDELLSRKILIAKTFENRNSVSSFPLRVIINTTTLPTQVPVQVLFTVPKRNFKLAVSRNLIRRRIKESYRKNKHELYQYLQKNNLQLAIVIIYTSKKEISYSEIEKKLIISLQKIISTLEKTKD